MRKSRGLAAIGTVDDRFGGVPFLRKAQKKLFPDHWSFLLGEVAMYAFVIILLTGVFLTLFYNPSMKEVTYHGSYEPLRDVEMSEAYASTLHISFDVRGGLLMRQIHHWATIIFLAAICAHLLRNFFTGAFRKPRELNWLIGVLMFMLVMLNGLFGYSLPDDLLSGTGLRILEGVIVSVPVVGSYLMFFTFGGEFPGEDFMPRLYVVHVLLIPGILLALIPLHAIVLTWRQTHTQFPGKGRSNRNVRGYKFFPVFVVKTNAIMLFTFAVSAFLSTFFQINPVWLFGPYDPSHISAGSQPDWYMGFLEGALRIMPAWEINALGYTLPMSVLVPALLVPGLLFTGLAVYPFLERWVTGDREAHHVLDRPRDVPVRTGIGAAAVTYYGVLWAAGGNDLIAVVLHIDLFWTTWIFRFLVLAGPVAAYVIASRICLGLQRREQHILTEGVESGIIKRLPTGEYIEVHKTPSEDAEARLRARRPAQAREAALTAETAQSLETDEGGVEPPAARRRLTRLRVALYRRFAEARIDLPAADGGEERGRELPAARADELPAERADGQEREESAAGRDEQTARRHR